MSGGTTNTILRNLLSDTVYTVTVAPVYPEGEGLRMSETGKTCKLFIIIYILAAGLCPCEFLSLVMLFQCLRHS